MQKHIGLDIHKKFIFAAVVGSKGSLILERKIRNDPYELDKFFKGFDKDSEIALESCSCWEYVYDYLTDMGFTNVVLANPSRVRLIATSKKKTDSHDARVLADLLRMNALPTSYAPPSVIREQRQITRHRASLGRLKGVIKNKIHAILIRNGINQEFSDVFGQEGMNFLMSLEKRARGIAIRDELTDEWGKRGAKARKDYSILTAEISKATFDMTPGEYKNFKGLKHHNLRDHMDDIELILTMLGEATTTRFTKDRDSNQFPELQEDAKDGGDVAGDTRKNIEKKLGKSVISEDNYLEIPEGRKRIGRKREHKK